MGQVLSFVRPLGAVQFDDPVALIVPLLLFTVLPTFG